MTAEQDLNNKIKTTEIEIFVIKNLESPQN